MKASPRWMSAGMECDRPKCRTSSALSRLMMVRLSTVRQHSSRRVGTAGVWLSLVRLPAIELGSCITLASTSIASLCLRQPAWEPCTESDLALREFPGSATLGRNLTKPPSRSRCARYSRRPLASSRLLRRCRSRNALAPLGGTAPHHRHAIPWPQTRPPPSRRRSHAHARPQTGRRPLPPPPPRGLAPPKAGPTNRSPRRGRRLRRRSPSLARTARRRWRRRSGGAARAARRTPASWRTLGRCPGRAAR